MTGNFDPVNGTLQANAQNSVIETDLFSLQNVGLPDGGLFNGYKFVDIQLLNTTNLDTANSALVVENEVGQTVASFNLAKTDNVQTFNLTNVAASNTNIKLKFILNHTTATNLSQVDYVKLVGETDELVLTDLRVATPTVDGTVDYNRAEFTVNITVKNSIVKDVYVKIDMDKINGVLTDTATDTGLFSNVKFLMNSTGKYSVGSPLMFVITTLIQKMYQTVIHLFVTT